MAEVIKDGWVKGDVLHPGVKKDCFAIQMKDNKYTSAEEKRKDATYILKHIDHKDLGKGAFSQLLLEKLEIGREINVPDYIKNAIIWACGGNYNGD